VASAARELLNKSPNERSGVLSTAMSFLGLYRDPVVAEVTSRSAWRIGDLVDAARPTTLYFVIPPSDISRTKPLIRLMLNQIGRRLTEDLSGAEARQRLLLMLDEFPALGRLDFFESALAFMAGYRIKAFLIAQSLNQIEKAYGQNNSIIDNCHVRVSFATNDERTARRVSDALGTATEIRSQKNYAGHRLSPWLGHLMVSRQESARPLLTVGEVQELPNTDELVLVSGISPIRAKKARYFSDPRFRERLLPAPETGTRGLPVAPDDWTGRPQPSKPDVRPDTPQDAVDEAGEEKDPVGAEARRQPEMDVTAEPDPPPRDDDDPFRDPHAQGPRRDPAEDEDLHAVLAADLARKARQAMLDPGNDLGIS